MTLNVRADAPTTDHPIKVYYPFGGKMLMLHWYTDGDRGHSALAPTDRKLRAIARRVFEEHVSEVDIKSVCEIEVVAPSKRLLAAAAKHNDKDRIEDFRRELTIEMRVVLDAGKLLPEPFAACNDYAFSSDEERAHYVYEDGEYICLDNHSGCVNCDMRVRLIGMTPRELYEKYHDRWRAAHPVKSHHIGGRLERTTSRAEMAADDELLWFAGADFGHHQKGIYLQEIDYAELDAELDSEYRPAYIGENVLFYFRKLRELRELKSDLLEMRNDIDGEQSMKEERVEMARKAEQERRQARLVEQTVSFFKDR